MPKQLTEEEERVFVVFPLVDPEDGSVTIQGNTGKICLEIDDNSMAHPLTEYDQGIYDTILEVLSCPLATLHTHLEETLLKILQNQDTEINETSNEDEELEEITGTQLKNTPANNNTPNVTYSAPLPGQEDDISDDELLKELSEKDNAMEQFDSKYPINNAYCDTH